MNLLLLLLQVASYTQRCSSPGAGHDEVGYQWVVSAVLSASESSRNKEEVIVLVLPQICCSIH